MTLMMLEDLSGLMGIKVDLSDTATYYNATTLPTNASPTAIWLLLREVNDFLFRANTTAEQQELGEMTSLLLSDIMSSVGVDTEYPLLNTLHKMIEEYIQGIPLRSSL